MDKKKNSIKNWIREERPREKLFDCGAENLSNSELLAIIIRTGTKGKNARDLALDILNKFGSLNAIDKLTAYELSKIKGIGFSKSVQIKAAFELGRRLIREERIRQRKITSLDEAVDYIFETQGLYIRDKDKEYFFILLLNIKNSPLETLMISSGSSNATVVDIKEITRIALSKNASGVIVFHNHPSGDTNPSRNDIEITAKIKSALELFNIRLIDHIIIGKTASESFSFAKHCMI